MYAYFLHFKKYLIIASTSSFILWPLWYWRTGINKFNFQNQEHIFNGNFYFSKLVFRYRFLWHIQPPFSTVSYFVFFCNGSIILSSIILTGPPPSLTPSFLLLLPPSLSLPPPFICLPPLLLALCSVLCTCKPSCHWDSPLLLSPCNFHFRIY